MDRFEEAQKVKHCALSLVGEPIMYPRVNELVRLLHSKQISTFLVTNAQFPDRIKQLTPVTQLYVSIDAPTKESLKAVDRPLFGDFWERYLTSLEELSKKPQRTVFRLTLVKEYNTDDLPAYARLVAIGKPDFIEVKGVTYCGYSGANPLTMSHVPFHREVIAFVQELNKLLLDSDGEPIYGIACEHEHSCSMLLANRKKYYMEGRWFTWIDYERFHELINSGQQFASEDYRALTPNWALYQAPERGFDPTEQRFVKKRGTKDEPIDHGC